MEQKRTNSKVASSVVKSKDQALVFVETRGKTGAISVLDIMPKTSEVNFVNRVNIGSGLVSVIYSGEVAACQAAQTAAGELASNTSELVATNVIPRPHERIYSVIEQVSGSDKGSNPGEGRKNAVGMIETEGFVSTIEAADSGIKAANVTIPGWVTVGSGLTTVFFRGEVAAVYSAVEAGCAAAKRLGNIVSTHVIAQPHAGTEKAVPIGKLSNDDVSTKASPEAALGILETRGITGLIEGIDAGLKAANVIVQGWEKIGRGITSVLFRGSVADVKSALEAAVKNAEKVNEVLGSYVIARPHLELEKGK